MFDKTIFNLFKKALPLMSRTEREALEAGSVWWDGELFGDPTWTFLDETPHTPFTNEEQAFIQGPVQELCEMLDDYDICQHRADLPDEVWDFLKRNRFLGMVIPREYGGLEFSARAHAAVVMKIATRSIAAAVTVMVPNSLGPGELILHYGTKEEKQRYLPTLADGTDIPCFALTSPFAGSDATSIPDIARVGMGKWEGVDGVEYETLEECVGLYLTFDKRYITLAPVATLMGLAVRVIDPEGLLRGKLNLKLAEQLDHGGITVILTPTQVPGIEIGNRHNPLDVGFMNGPVRGKEVFVPLHYILGGTANIGRGWKMLVECLSVGRAISLPALACGGSKLAAMKTGAYARIRKQFKLPIGKFEGVEEPLARIAGYTFIMNATRKLTLRAIDNGHKPSVLSAICKYHLTEMNRQVINDAMDIQGGSGICLGPRNYLGRMYQSLPIGITVEGANILTRNMIIFGQGVMRSHPLVRAEMIALEAGHSTTFGYLLLDHIKYFFANLTRTVFHGLTGARFSRVPGTIAPTICINTRKQVNRLSAAFAFMTDIALLIIGGKLKRKERISARHGDILSYLYMLSAIGHEIDSHFLVAGRNTASIKMYKALYKWANDTLLYQTQEAFYDLFANYPSRLLGRVLRLIVFPFGRSYKKPSDKMDHEIAQILLSDNPIRSVLINGAFVSDKPGESLMERTFRGMDRYDEIEKKIRTYLKGVCNVDTFTQAAQEAVTQIMISEEDAKFAIRMYKQISELVQVDDFEAV